MNALILAAGYATRLYPLTKDFPKPLLEVGGRTILDHLVDKLAGLATVERVVIVTNHRFAPFFEKWRSSRREEIPSAKMARHDDNELDFSFPASIRMQVPCVQSDESCSEGTVRWQAQIIILDDGTTSNEDRLGAIGDLELALQEGLDGDDLLVAAGDNILQFSLAEFVASCRARPAAHVCVHWVEDLERCRRTGIAVLDTEDRVIEFAEKPPEPKTRWAVPPLYLLPKATLAKVRVYLAEGGSRDTPGRFIEWLCRREPVFAFRVRGAILDIGTPQSLEAARKTMTLAR